VDDDDNRVCAAPTVLRSFEPASDPPHRLVHLGVRPGIAEPDEVPAVERIEIRPGRRCYVCFLKHALGEVEAVVREARHVGIEVERAVDREKGIEPGARQAGEQNARLSS